MKKPLLAISCLLCFCLLSTGVVCQEPTYPVGFKRMYAYDYSRLYNWKFPDTTQQQKRFRPVVINIWYPSKKETAQPMRMDGYLSFRNAPPELSSYFAKVRRDQLTLSRYYTFGDRNGESENGDTSKHLPVVTALYQQYLSLSTNAVMDAKPEKGRFPLLLFHSGLGGTADDNAEMCEFFASQGYIVVSSLFQPALPEDRATIDYDLERSKQDIDFMINWAHTAIPNCDFENTVLMGHSFGAQAAAYYAGFAGVPLKAAILLDGTTDYEFSFPHEGFTVIRNHLFSHVASYTQPLLVAAEPEATFRMTDSLKQSERDYIKVSALSHNDFIAIGVLARKILLGQNRDAPAQTKVITVYHELQQLLLRYCNAIVKNAPRDRLFDGLVYITHEKMQKGQTRNSATVPYFTGSNKAPTLSQLVDLVNKDGAAAAKKLAASFVATDSSLYDCIANASRAFYFGYRKYDTAIELATWLLEWWPARSESFYRLGLAYRSAGQPVLARHFVEKALQLDPANKDARTALDKLK